MAGKPLAASLLQPLPQWSPAREQSIAWICAAPTRRVHTATSSEIPGSRSLRWPVPRWLNWPRAAAPTSQSSASLPPDERSAASCPTTHSHPCDPSSAGAHLLSRWEDQTFSLKPGKFCLSGLRLTTIHKYPTNSGSCSCLGSICGIHVADMIS